MAQTTTNAKVKTGRQVAEEAKRGDRDRVATAAWGPSRDAERHEAMIADAAAEIRGEDFDGRMTRALFLKLWPLLRRPLPAGYVVHTTKGKGKPYASDGAKSAQVLVDRMNNVLTPLCWDYREEYQQDGKVCNVTVTVFDGDGAAIVSRSSWGGVNQGGTLGNVYKGSWTNAAKLAFARLGPGREIYLGVLDFDPDTNADVAELQTSKSPQRAKAAATGEAGTTTDVDTALQQLLDQDDPLKAKRLNADKGMQLAGTPAAQRLEYLRGAPDERSLDSLQAQLDAYLRQQEGEGGGAE